MSGRINFWLNAHSLALLAATLLGVLGRSPLPVGAVALASFSFLLLSRGAAGEKALPGNLAHWLTGFRLVIVLIVAVAMYRIPAVAVFAIFLVNLGLDVADGYVARKHGTESYAGAIFDQEVDAFFVLVACLYFYFAVGIGAWVLLPGILRYAYRLVVWFLHSVERQEQRQTHAAILAGLNFVLLTIAVVLPSNPQLAVLAGSTALFVVSFALSFWRLVRAEHENSVSR